MPHPLSRIEPVFVVNPEEGVEKAKDLLLDLVKKDTALFLSGGTTPGPVYKKLAQEEEFRPRIVAMVDERIDGSNEAMIKETGLITSFDRKGIQFVSVVRPTVRERYRLATFYEPKVREIFYDHSIERKVAVMGVGDDGHTAGIFPNTDMFINPVFGKDYERRYVCDYDSPGRFEERITLTPFALRQINVFIVLAFGEGKKEVLQRVVRGEQEKIEEFPAIIFRQLAQKGKHIYIITDQAL